MKVFQPEPSTCDNKWCTNHGSIPTNGLLPQVSKCGNIGNLKEQQLLTGGITGRGVTPCPFGFLQHNGVLSPYRTNTTSIFFQPERPGYLPPQGNPRPLNQIGYTWRN